jgi:ribosomal protein S18 acetylase RimI-like enzyme
MTVLLSARHASAAVTRLLTEPQWGRIYLMETQTAIVGYLTVCIGYSIELGGNDAFIDELYVLTAYRRHGHARRALEFVTESAVAWGICALHLEVDRDNDRAQRLYPQLGYLKRDRYYFMTAVLRSAG